jgi:DNA-binding MarR family transcriptional regulator
MPTRRKIPPAAADLARRAPFLGAHLRMAYEATRRRVLTALAERGFADLNPAHLIVFQYPPPDGIRPTDLAERTFMSKQAVNHLLGELETLGYIERRTDRGSVRRLVFLTRRGWQVCETQWTVMQDIEIELSATFGPKVFAEFMKALRHLSALDTKRRTIRSAQTD